MPFFNFRRIYEKINYYRPKEVLVKYEKIEQYFHGANCVYGSSDHYILQVIATACETDALKGYL